MDSSRCSGEAQITPHCPECGAELSLDRPPSGPLPEGAAEPSAPDWCPRCGASLRDADFAWDVLAPLSAVVPASAVACDGSEGTPSADPTGRRVSRLWGYLPWRPRLLGAIVLVVAVVAAGLGTGTYVLVHGRGAAGTGGAQAGEVLLYPVRDPVSGRYGYIDPHGKVVIPAHYSEAGYFSEGLALVQTGSSAQYGYIDPSGEMVIPARFGSATDFSEGLAGVQKPGTDAWSYIDKSGLVVLPGGDGTAEYEVETFSGGLVVAAGAPSPGLDANDSAKLYGFVDRTGKFAIPPAFWAAEKFSNGLALVKSRNPDGKVRYGYIDTTGVAVIERKYIRAESFSEGLAAVEVSTADDPADLRWGYIDTTGAVAIKADFWEARQFAEGLAVVQSSDAYGRLRYGYVDTSGRMAIEARFTAAREFSQGLAAVQWEPGGRYGYIDKTGTVVIQPQFYDAGDFLAGGLAEVELSPPDSSGPGTSHGIGTHSCYIDRTGAVVWPHGEAGDSTASRTDVSHPPRQAGHPLSTLATAP